jgi:hypothetical protein
LSSGHPYAEDGPPVSRSELVECGDQVQLRAPVDGQLPVPGGAPAHPAVVIYVHLQLIRGLVVCADGQGDADGGGGGRVLAEVESGWACRLAGGCQIVGERCGSAQAADVPCGGQGVGVSFGQGRVEGSAGFIGLGCIQQEAQGLASIQAVWAKRRS